MPDKPLTAVLIGLGHRALLYGSYALNHPDELAIVGLADPDRGRLGRAAAMFDIPPERCYRTSQELAAQPRFADAAI
ncbi:MAG: gfo/Idh/MocA family oxidoreductase, partial [Anaerolineae bacterium]|nr:gfo/Idh/MocA family oxidoreductase [Anaerolineae bacterium]